MSVWVCVGLWLIIFLGFYGPSANKLMEHVDPGKAQAVRHNVYWIKRSGGDVFLNKLEQNPQQEQGRKGNENTLLVFISKGEQVQRPCNKITDDVQPEAAAEIFGKIQSADGGIIDKGCNGNGEKPDEKYDF
jgi:hypothetical protein